MLIHVDVWQKPSQYCKAIILQLNKLNQNKKLRQENYEISGFVSLKISL